MTLNEWKRMAQRRTLKRVVFKEGTSLRWKPHGVESGKGWLVTSGRRDLDVLSQIAVHFKGGNRRIWLDVPLHSPWLSRWFGERERSIIPSLMYSWLLHYFEPIDGRSLPHCCRQRVAENVNVCFCAFLWGGRRYHYVPHASAHVPDDDKAPRATTAGLILWWNQ